MKASRFQRPLTFFHMPRELPFFLGLLHALQNALARGAPALDNLRRIAIEVEARASAAWICAIATDFSRAAACETTADRQQGANLNRAIA